MPRWLRIALLGILLLTVIDGAYLVKFSIDSTNANVNGKYEDHGQPYRPDGPVAFVVIQTFSSIEAFVEAHDKFFVVLSTIAVAGFTFTLWRATDGLFRTAERQANDLRRSMCIAQQSADAARDAAVAAKESNIQRALESRPIVLPLIIDATKLLPPRELADKVQSHRPELRFAWENLGKTPAIIQSVGYELCFLSEAQKNAPREHWESIAAPQTLPGESRNSNWIESTPHRFHRALSPEEILQGFRSYKNGPAKRFFLFGVVRYDDVFGKGYVRDFVVKFYPNGSHRFKLDTEREIPAKENAKLAQQNDEEEAGEPPARARAGLS